jgi:hypothetical protein
MALQKQVVNLNLTGGVQTKDDPFTVIPSKLTVADNVEFDDKSTLRTRDAQVRATLASGSNNPAVRMFTHQGNALLERFTTLERVKKSGGSTQIENPPIGLTTSAPSTFRRAAMEEKVVSRTPLYSVQNLADLNANLSISSLVMGGGSVDVAVLGDYNCYVYETADTSQGVGVVVRVVDTVNNIEVVNTTLYDTLYFYVKPKVVSVTSGVGGVPTFYVFLFRYDPTGVTTSVGKMMYATVKPSTAAVSAVAVVTDEVYAPTSGLPDDSEANQFLYDVTARGTTILIVHKTDTSGTYCITDLDATSDEWTDVAIPTASGNIKWGMAALISVDGSAVIRYHALYTINTDDVKGRYYNKTTSVTSASEVTLANLGTGTSGTIAAVQVSTSLCMLAYFNAGGTEGSNSRYVTFTHSQGSPSDRKLAVSWAPSGKFATLNSRIYLPMRIPSEFQETHYIVDVTASYDAALSGIDDPPLEVLTRAEYGAGGTSLAVRGAQVLLPNLATRDAGFVTVYIGTSQNAVLVGSSSTSTLNITVPVLRQLSVDTETQLAHEEVLGVTFLSGACPHIFDGLNYFEEGFHHAPEITVNSSGVATLSSSTSPWALPADTKTYTICFTVGWQDAAGNWYESYPSNEATVTSSATVRYLPETSLARVPTSKRNVTYRMYRTLGSSTDTTLYLAAVGSASSYIAVDATLASGEQLYTSGGVLPNTPAPACRQVSTFQKRLVLSGCGDGSKVHWSKQTQAGYGPEFCTDDPTHQTSIPASYGRAVGTMELDDKLAVVAEKAVGVIYGTGPAPTGTQGQYSDFQPIILELGGDWDSPKSIIRSTDGVWFRSPYGFRLMSRQGGLAIGQDGKQVGSEVDELASGTAVAVVGSTKQQVRFYQSVGNVLVWDTQWKQWSRFTGFGNIDACFADGRFYHVTNNSG